ncbi:TPR repeat-containing protein [Smittium culicis]|uniref:TPR repeat-containing protein n=1 Tax=Smittium culicis TaxID=133412 RepID=A0A1R1YTE9_9FUNG|nr:TPR repeat-containing protein [Smittium culicis]
MNYEYKVLTGKYPKTQSNKTDQLDSLDVFEILYKYHPSALLTSDYAQTFFGTNESLLEINASEFQDNFQEYLDQFYSEFLLTRIPVVFEKYGQEKGWRILSALGIACLSLFIQVNWTGPQTDFDSASLLPKPWSDLLSLTNDLNSKKNADIKDPVPFASEDSSKVTSSSIILEHTKTIRNKFDDLILSNLQVSGEHPYSLTNHPLLLYLAIFLLTRTVREFKASDSNSDPLKGELDFWLSLQVNKDLSNTRTSSSFSSSWWELRALRISQEIIDNPSGLLLTTLETGFSNLNTLLLNESPCNLDIYKLSPPEKKQLKIRFSLEYALMFQYYHKNAEANKWLEASQLESGLVWQLTGAKGKRTKFQENNISQLLVVAKSSPDNHDENDSEDQDLSMGIESTSEPKIAIKNLELNDDTLLEKTEYLKINDSDQDSPSNDIGVDHINQENLKMIDQCILLGFCLEVKNENPKHGLTTEQMMPFVIRVIENPNNWSIYTSSLLLRSRLEADKSRTVQRSALQLQALVDQTDQPLENEAGFEERFSYFFSLALPSVWELKKELANRLLSIGAIRSALDIFESLMMWDEAVSCYQILEQSHIAEKLVKKQLELLPNDPKLWSILGDLKQSPEFWKKSWEISGSRYTRSMRSLGGYYFKHSKMEECIEAYKKALKLNPLYDGSWYNMGCAALHLEYWDIAIEAFQRVCQLDNENAEAWNNLASVYLKQEDRKLDAWNCLREAIKFKFDNWQIWSNFLVTSVAIGQFASAIQSMTRIIELRVAKSGSSCVDVEILNIIIQSVTREQHTAANLSQNRMVQRNSRLNILVENLLVNTIAQKITDSPDIWRSMADFWFWKKDYLTCIECYEKAYRCSSLLPQISYEMDKFKTAIHHLNELVDIYRTLGPLPIPVIKSENSDPSSIPPTNTSSSPAKLCCPNYKLKCKMAIQGLINKSKSNFESTQEFTDLNSLLTEVSTMD